MNPTFLIAFSLLLVSSLYSQDEYFGDTMNFESAHEHLVLDPNSLWQIGKPQKAVFNSAYSPFHTITTDTVSPYGINEQAHFDLFISKSNLALFEEQVHVTIKYKMHSDSLSDGGYITTSSDGGLNWVNINEYPQHCWGFGVFDDSNYKDTLSNGEIGISGNITEWSSLSMDWEPVVALKGECDTLQIRFNFISDSIDTSKDGWIIDDIIVYAYRSVSVNEEKELKFQLFPNPGGNSLELRIQEDETDFEVVIRNSMGKFVRKYRFDQSLNVSLNTSTLEKGLYIVTIITEDGLKSVRKWIKSD